MVSSGKLKIYGIVLGIFVLGAGAGGGAGYAVASKRVAEVLADERPEAHEARRFEALAKELDLTREQRQQVRGIMDRHREENRRATRAVFEKCGSELSEVRSRVDGEIRAVLNAEQQKRFGELMDKRGKRFPLGAAPARFRKGGGHHD
jgi:Spy/CpxP family protein refolding chaperone